MPMTDEELAAADKLLAERQKNLSGGRKARWLLLMCGTLVIAVAILKIQVLPPSFPDDLGVDTTTQPRAITSLDLELERYRTASMLKSFVATFLAYLSLVISIAMGVYFGVMAMANWNKARNDGLLIKLARSYIEELRTRNKPDPDA